MSNSLGLGSPVMNDATFQRWDQREAARAEARLNQMTLQGTINATGILLGVCAAVGLVLYGILERNGAGIGAGFGIGMLGSLATLGVSLVLMFKQSLAPVLGLPAAALQGLLVGGFSYAYAAWMGGVQTSTATPTGGVTGTLAALDSSIVLQAATLTFGIAGGLLIAYSTRVIRVSDTFVKIIVAATFAVMLLFLAQFALGLFGVRMSFLSSGPIGIGVAGLIVGLAAMNLLVDFRMIEDGVKAGAPKYMNWFAAFGVLITIVWLYVSLLRLLAMLRRE